MAPLKIKIALLRAGLTQARIAKEYGCTPVAVHLVISGKLKSRGIQKHIAGRLELPVENIFPESRRIAA